MNMQRHSWRTKKGWPWYGVMSQLHPNYAYNWNVSASWRLANIQYSYFKNSIYSKGVVTLRKGTSLSTLIRAYKIQAGDLAYFDDDGNGVPNHATIITKVTSNMIYYSAHTSNRRNYKITNYTNQNYKLKVYIVRMR